MGQEKEKKSPFCLQRMHGTADFSDILLLRLGSESIGFLLLYTRQEMVIGASEQS